MAREESLPPIDLARAADFLLQGVPIRPSVRQIGEDATRETLEPRVMQVLVALAQRFGEVVSRDALIATCWGGRIVGDEAITVCMTKLRRIGLAHGAFRIETVPRVGYRMVEPPLAFPGGSPGPTRKSLLVLSAIALIAVAGGAAIYARWNPAPATNAPLVAIAPFRALSDDPASQAFIRIADTEIGGGLRERLLQVTRASSGGKSADFVVNGVASQVGGRTRIRTMLTEPGSQIILWSAEFEAPPEAAERMTQPIAARVATVIDLATDARRTAGPGLQASTLALYLQVCDSAGLADSEIGHSLDQVLQQAPQLTRARLVRARSRLRESFFSPRAAFEIARSEAIADAREALRRDAQASESYAVLALAMDGRRWSDREALLERSLTGRPSIDSQDAMIRFLASTGRLDQAARRARDIATSGRVWAGVSWQADYVIYLAGAQREAMLYVDRDLAARPTDALLKLAKLLIASGDQPAASAEVLSDPPRGIVAAIRPGTAEAFGAFAAAKQDGSAASRREAVDRIVKAVAAKRLLPDQAIPMLANLGGLDEAFLLAHDMPRNDLAVRTAAALSTGFLFGPDTVAMRRDRRFIGLMHDLGLLDYWRRSGHWPDFCETEPGSVCAAMKRRPSRRP